ncbi:MAG: deoxyribodipyrimidine photo-lyase [Sulfolobales archaeon]|nr:deoxyribodipyrimidine photo-lyase [Sulfolobales archaeon]
MRVLYWFRRDLRAFDNRALSEASSTSDRVAAVYVLDPRLLGVPDLAVENPRISLVADALLKLSSEVELHVLHGRAPEVFEELLGRYCFNAVYTAKPISWSEEEVVDEVREVCSRNGVKLVEVVDNVLVDPSRIKPVGTFTAFYRQWRKLVDTERVGRVRRDRFAGVDAPSAGEVLRKLGIDTRRVWLWSVDWGLRRVELFDYSSYSRLRDYPHLDGSSKLSPYISVGAISIRELYERASGVSEEFVRQLAWREFYYYLKSRYPWMRRLELKPRMRGIEWENDEHLVEAFKEGRTGYPIVDAGIRQLKSEFWIHNRVRLVVANFLVKDLHVDWRIGEDFFREYLVDYDEVLNAGNWQWSASVGVDPVPIRVFNPIKQVEKYDPDCAYVKKYIPELEGYSCREIADPLTHKLRGYYEPVVDHYERVRKFASLAKMK